MNKNVNSNSFRNIRKHFSGRFYFSLFVIISAVVSLFAAYFTRGEIVGQLLFPNCDAYFSDFFDSVYDSSLPNPYVTRKVIYPALIYIFYSIIVWFVPKETVLGGSHAIRNSQCGQMIFHIYCVVLVVAILFVLLKLMDSGDIVTKIFCVSVIIGCPFIYAYERGNSILVSLLFMLLFFCYKDSDSKAMRELSLIFLAIAAVIKIYPAIFGLLLIAEKRLAEALRCVIYGIAVFALPFFLYGGPKGIVYMFKNILKLSGTFGEQYGFQVSIRHALSYISKVAGLGLADYTSYFAATITAVLAVSFLLTRQYYKRILSLTLICILVPGFNWLYALVYLIPAMVIYFKDNPKMSGSRIYGVCFILIFCWYPINIVKRFPKLSVKNFAPLYEITLGVIICNIALFVLALALLVGSVKEVIYRIYNKNRNNYRRRTADISY